MVKFLIATHGYLADGMKSTLSIIMGAEIAERISTINAFVDEHSPNPEQLIAQYCDALNNDDTAIIFTDMMFGSVNRLAMPFANRNQVYLITGMNFPIVLELISQYAFDENAKVSLEECERIVEKARLELQVVNDTISSDDDNNEDDFFN